MAAISQGQGRLRSNLQTMCLLPLAMSQPSFVKITKIHLEKSEKILFSTLKMATIYQGQGRLRSNLQTTCPLPLAMLIPSFVRITKIDWEKIAKV